LSKKIRILKRKLLKTAGDFQILVGTSKDFENLQKISTNIRSSQQTSEQRILDEYVAMR